MPHEIKRTFKAKYRDGQEVEITVLEIMFDASHLGGPDAAVESRLLFIGEHLVKRVAKGWYYDHNWKKLTSDDPNAP